MTSNASRAIAISLSSVISRPAGCWRAIMTRASSSIPSTECQVVTPLWPEFIARSREYASGPRTSCRAISTGTKRRAIRTASSDVTCVSS